MVQCYYPHYGYGVTKGFFIGQKHNKMAKKSPKTPCNAPNSWCLIHVNTLYLTSLCIFSDRGSVKSPQRPLDQVSEPSLVSREERDIERSLPSQLTLVLNRDPANIYKSERLGWVRKLCRDWSPISSVSRIFAFLNLVKKWKIIKSNPLIVIINNALFQW